MILLRILKQRDYHIFLLIYDMIHLIQEQFNKTFINKYKTDFFFAAEMIFLICFFERIFPVGLFGLHNKTQPFLGIIEINESRFSERFIVLKKVNLQSTSFDADSYSPKVGTGIKTRFFDKNAVQKL